MSRQMELSSPEAFALMLGGGDLSPSLIALIFHWPELDYIYFLTVKDARKSKIKAPAETKNPTRNTSYPNSTA